MTTSRQLIAIAIAAAFAAPALAQTSNPPPRQPAASSEGASGTPQPRDSRGGMAQGDTRPSAAGSSAMSFERMDKDNDGYISRSEAKGNKDVEDRFNTLDTNRDGKLSRSELKAAESSSVGSGRTGPGADSTRPDPRTGSDEPRTVPGPGKTKSPPTPN